MPRPCAVRTISSHVSAGSLPFVSTHRTSSSRISAAVPGIVPSPWRLGLGQELLERDAELRRAVEDLHRAERVDVHLGRAPLHRVDEVEVERARQIGVDAALHADLGGALAPRFLGAVGDLGERERVGLVVDLTLGERAEPAAHVADVREVDVAVDDVGDVVADGLGAQTVGDPAERVERVALGPEQRERLVVGDRPVRLGLGERASGSRHRGARARPGCAPTRGRPRAGRRRRRRSRRRRAVRHRRPSRR